MSRTGGEYHRVVVQGAGERAGGGIWSLNHRVGERKPVLEERKQQRELVERLSLITVMPPEFYNKTRLRMLKRLAREQFDNMPLGLMRPDDLVRLFSKNFVVLEALGKTNK